MLTAISSIGMLVLLFLDVPVFVAVLAGSLIYFTFNQELSYMFMIQRMIGGVQSVPLLAVPFFVMAGVFMNYTGITKRLMKFCEVLTGHLPGGIAQVAIALSTIMGGLSGSALADAAMEAKMLVPEMEKRGIHRSFAAAVCGASAIITPIIPPGIAMIIYGFIANVSIGKLFIAGIIPGLLCCFLMMLATHLVAKKRGYAPLRSGLPQVKEVVSSSKAAILALILPVVIIGGIRIGIFTPTEAGAVATLYALILGTLVYHEMKLAHFKKAIMETVVTTGSIALIIAAASSFAWFMTWERVPQTISGFVVSVVHSPAMFLLVLNIFLLIVGMFLEGTAAMIVLVPIFVPIARAMGIDDVQFGMTFIFNMAIGSLSPPMGTLMFIMCSTTNVKIKDYIKESWPFYIVLLIILLLITYVKPISTFLPNLLIQ